MAAFACQKDHTAWVTTHTEEDHKKKYYKNNTHSKDTQLLTIKIMSKFVFKTCIGKLHDVVPLVKKNPHPTCSFYSMSIKSIDKTVPKNTFDFWASTCMISFKKKSS